MKLANGIKLWVLLAFAVLLLVIGFALYRFRFEPTPNFEQFTLEELVELLPNERIEGLGDPRTKWVFPFDDVNAKGNQDWHRCGRSDSPVLFELVARGVSALPTLIDHLTDARPTRTYVRNRGGFIYLGDLYEQRDFGRRKRLPGVNTREFQIYEENEYCLRVGDLCFMAIGQIVNRQTPAVRSKAAFHVVVNSPVERPAIVDAIHSDWALLTQREHVMALIRDSLDSSEYTSENAIARIRFYYPDAYKIYLRENRSLAMSAIVPGGELIFLARCINLPESVVGPEP